MDPLKIRALAKAIDDQARSTATSNPKRVKTALIGIGVKAQAIIADVDAPTAPPPVVEPPPVVTPPPIVVTPPPVPTPSGNIIDVTAGEPLQSIIDRAPAGSVIRLEMGAAFPCDLVIKTDKVQIVPRTSVAPGVRVTKAMAAGFPRLVGTVEIQSADVLIGGGVTVQGTVKEATLITDNGIRTVLDKLAILGSPNGQRRGIAPHGTDAKILNCHIDDIWYPDEDAQAICGWDGTNGLLIQNNYLSATAQSVMFGGGDPADATRSPKRVTMIGNLLTKDPSWRAISQRVKCALELKNIDGFTAQHNEFEYSGADHGQAGYLIVLTPRNQDGNAPYSAVTNVLIEDSIGRHSAGCINMLGSDDEPIEVRPGVWVKRVSGPLDNVIIRRMIFEDIGGSYPGDRRMFMVNNAPKRVTMEEIAVSGSRFDSTGYFTGAPPVGMVLRRITAPKSYWGWKIDGGGQGLAAVQQYAPDMIIDTVTE